MWRVYKNFCPAKISASIMVANMWKNSLKNVESDNYKVLYETLLDFIQRNGTYVLNKLRTCISCLVYVQTLQSPMVSLCATCFKTHKTCHVRIT